VLAGILVLAPLAYFAARPSVNHWRYRQALAQADRFEAQGDYRNLVLALHRATLIAPGDIETWRRVARTLDLLGAGEALVAHENIVNLAPGDARARTALATAALRLGASEIARNALRELRGQPAEREAYLRLSGELARADGDWPRYEQSLAELRALRPDDAEIQLNSALLLLASTSDRQQQQARGALIQLLRQLPVRTRAALALLNHAARRRSPELAGDTVRVLVENLSASRALISSSADLWPALITAMQRSAAATDPADVARIAQWMGSIKRAPEAMTWLSALPAETKQTPVVREITAELCARTDTLPELQRLLSEGAWGPMLRESVRLAIEGRSEALAQRTTASFARWQEAVVEAEQSPETLRRLARLARLWQNDLAFENAAKALLRRQPDSVWANRELCEFYLARGETEKLFSQASAWAALEPVSGTAVWLWVRTGAALGRLDAQMDFRTSQLLATEAPPMPLVMARALYLARKGNLIAAKTLIATQPNFTENYPEASLLLFLAKIEKRHGQDLPATFPALLPEEKSMLNQAP